MIAVEKPGRSDVRELLKQHLEDMHAISPAESVHALDLEALAGPEVTFWTAREGGTLLGCGALKELPGLVDEIGSDGEIKSMRTSAAARRRGVAVALLGELIAEARRRGYRRLYLETGSQEFFAPARQLYRRHGFEVTEPFGSYRLDPNSVFMMLLLNEVAPDQPSVG
ncbi:GNAT family N-acetyltransferase [Psychromicrobium silvestre]|uniref:GNAT family N-acetyltransferase n=1 Tax=Psychromicrobium silvestre TaxID=1645614 RepID=UPI001FEA6922|nr:GNAT family N-acetyltransferase [Psychromicrobium silvestre]